MPGIDRDHWLDFAKDNVSKSIQRREDAATKLDDFLSWLWGIYTSIFALASLLGFMSNSLELLISVSQPILIIMLARFTCKMVLMPSINDSANADPNVVPEIIESFMIMVADKKKKLRMAIFGTIVSVISICFALIGYNVFDSNKEIKQKIQKEALKKELNDKTVKTIKAQQTINDSVKLENESYDLRMQNELKQRKLDCILSNNQKCVDTLKALEK